MTARIMNAEKAAALFGAVAFLLAAVVCTAPAGPTPDVGGTGFLKGRVHDAARAGASLEERFAAARSEAARSSPSGTFFAAARFESVSRIHFGRPDGAGPLTVASGDSRIIIRETSGDDPSVREGDEKRTPSPAAWLILSDVKTGRVVDATILDPERTYAFDSQAVFWLGNPPGAESLSFIETRFQAASDPEVRERMLLVLSRHNDSRVYGLLRRIALEDREMDVRRSAVFWLGTIPDPRAPAGLKEIYRLDRDPEIKERVVFALSLRPEKEAVLELIRIARKDADDSVRRNAVFWLGQKASAESVRALKDIIESPGEERQLKEQAVFAVSQLPPERAVPMLIDIARTHRSSSVRKKALFWLGQTGDPAALKLFEEILLKK